MAVPYTRRGSLCNLQITYELARRLHYSPCKMGPPDCNQAPAILLDARGSLKEVPTPSAIWRVMRAFDTAPIARRIMANRRAGMACASMHALCHPNVHARASVPLCALSPKRDKQRDSVSD